MREYAAALEEKDKKLVVIGLNSGDGVVGVRIGSEYGLVIFNVTHDFMYKYTMNTPQSLLCSC